MSSKDINYLLKNLTPQLSTERLVFISMAPKQAESHLLAALAVIQESEGTTLVLSQAYADDKSLLYDGCYNNITLEVHSDLTAVGLTAAFADALTKQNIPANVIAGYYHDHILVPEQLAELALNTLKELSEQQP